MATLGYLMARLMSALALSLKANGLLDEDPFPPLGGHCHSSLAKVFKLTFLFPRARAPVQLP